MSPSLGSACLRDFLRLAGSSKSDVSGISSHSLKATCLSWAAKAGMPRELRQILGYHIVPGTMTALRCSRDKQAELFRRLSKILSQIRNGVFNPDASRSGYWTSSEMLMPTPKFKPMSSATVEKNNKQVLADQSSDSDSSSTSSKSSSTDKWSDEEIAFSRNKDMVDLKRRKGAIIPIDSKEALLGTNASHSHVEFIFPIDCYL